MAIEGQAVGDAAVPAALKYVKRRQRPRIRRKFKNTTGLVSLVPGSGSIEISRGIGYKPGGSVEAGIPVEVDQDCFGPVPRVIGGG
jgi:hypothetical protein